MLLRLSLVIAVAATLGALFFSHVKVAERITTLTTDLETEKGNAQKAGQAASAARTEAKKSKDEADKANKSLEEKAAVLEAATAKLTEQEERGNKLFAELQTTKKEKTEAQQELNAYRAAGLKPDEIRAAVEQLTSTRKERDVFLTENKVMLRENDRLQRELKHYTTGDDINVPLPAGLKGKVVAVDPKYDFVVLDIGGNQGVLEHGKMLVNRNGKLVATVQITKVEPNRSIANVIPEYKQDDVMEGDQVIIHR